jgi:hypothetical protein
VRIFAFVAAQEADFAVRALCRVCRVCRVSASGFYAWAARIARGRPWPPGGQRRAHWRACTRTPGAATGRRG